MDETTITVEIPRIGTKVTFEGKAYVIISTQTFQEQYTETPRIITYCRLLEIDDKGHDLGKDTFLVRLEEVVLNVV